MAIETTARQLSITIRRKISTTTISGLLVATFLLPVATPVLAQSDSIALEEIVVTASKRGAISSQDLAASIITFDSETLEKMGVEQFVDFSRSTPGLDVIDTGPGQKQYLIRGLSGPGESTVGVYYDSIPMSGSGQDPVSFGANQPDLDMFDTQRVEVLRGPQGTQYGASSLSGVVRIISNKPDASETSGKLMVKGGAVSGGDPNYAIKGMFNLPLVEDVFAIRAVGYFDHLGGYIDNGVLFKGPDDNSCYGPGTSFGSTEPEVILNPACQDGAANFTNINEHERSGGRLFAQWDVSDETTILFQTFFQQMESGGRNAANPVDSLYEGFGPPFIPGGNSFFTPAVGDDQTNIRGHEPYEEDLTIFALELDHDFESAHLSISANMMDREADSRLDSSSPARLHRRFFETPLGPWGGVSVTPFDRITVVQAQETEVLSLEARLASQNEGRFNYLVGAYYSDRTLKVDSKALATDPRTGDFLVGDTPYLDRNAKNETDMVAIFGEVYFDLTEQFEVLVGARWFETNRDQFSDLVVPFLRSPIIGGPPGVETNEPASESDTIFKAQATYRFSDDVSTYLTYSEGFRAGGVNAQITPNIPDSFDFDETSNIEWGLKSLLADGRVIVNIALYQIDWKQIQMNASFTSQFNGLVNCDQQSDPVQSRGIEIDTQFAITDSLIAGINYSKLDATWQVDADSCVSQEVLDELSDPFGSLAGDSLTGVPDYSGSAFMQYDWNMNIAEGAYFRADIQFQGEVSVNEPRPERNIVNPSYVFGHIKFGMDWERFSATLYVRNVTDETAWLSLFNNFQQENRVTVNQPRTIGASFEMRF